MKVEREFGAKEKKTLARLFLCILLNSFCSCFSFW